MWQKFQKFINWKFKKFVTYTKENFTYLKCCYISGFLKTTDQPTIYRRPPTNRPTDHRPIAQNTDQPTIDQ